MTKQEFKNGMQAAVEGTVSDATNPVFIFSMTATELLLKIASGEINAQELAKRELEARMVKF